MTINENAPSLRDADAHRVTGANDKGQHMSDSEKQWQVAFKGRQMGRTSIAMLEAPFGSIYVWCNNHLSYPKDLARSLGRSDLQIVSSSWLEPDNVRGLRPDVKCVIDHAFHLFKQSSNAFEALYYIEQNEKRFKGGVL